MPGSPFKRDPEDPVRRRESPEPGEVVVKSTLQTLFVPALALVVVAPGIAAQDARISEVRTAVERTLEAWKTGDFETFAGYYHPAARGFFLDGGPRLGGFEVPTLQAAWEAGFRTQLEIRDLEIALHGEAAVVSAYLAGSLTLPGGGEVPGTWRYTETRVPANGTWKVVQYHFSPREEAPAGGR